MAFNAPATKYGRGYFLVVRRWAVEVSGRGFRSIILVTWKRPPWRLLLRAGKWLKIGCVLGAGCGSWPHI